MPLGLINNDYALQKATLKTAMIEAMHNQDETAYLEKFEELCGVISKEIIAESEELTWAYDQQVLRDRGVRTLTSAENKYYTKVISALKSTNPQQALSSLDVVMPETVIDQVFEDLRTNHALLNAINFNNTQGAIRFLISHNERQKAVWGNLGTAITEEIDGSFEEIDMTLMKLTAWIPVSLDMLDLGPNWLDRYTRECLYEALANGLEDGIINNLDTSTGPIGMIADLTSGNTGTPGKIVYAAKEATVVNDLKPVTIGSILAKLAVDKDDKPRNVSNVILVVNAVDYLTKVFPATTVMNGNGTYVNNVLPYPMTVIQSAAVASNKSVIGLANKYFMGLGMSSKDGRIEYSDQFKFLDDVRTYKIKLYANGRPLDNNAFQYLDITNLKPLTIAVTVDGNITTQDAGVGG